MDEADLDRHPSPGTASMCTCPRPHNRLVYEKSPYLLQHAHNPVDWYPWGEEALEEARRQKKPVFLSIGYSTCHWCHVMERECFEDPEIARLLNDICVSIKVDREERPDLDNIYMTVSHLLTGRGGWPLTIFMTPEGGPFFAATYIPKETRSGQIGLRELLLRIDELWKTRRDEVIDSASRLVRALQEGSRTAAGDDLEESVLKRGFEELAEAFDKRWGGFGTAPKFPMAHQLVFLLRYWSRSGEREALEMAVKTLELMRRGGIYDQVGFGFHRYSTDAEWRLPHFEKMLYDQAMLAMAYAEAYQATRNGSFGTTVREILSYVSAEMTSPQGGFFSAQDADSGGEEGAYYLWRAQEIRAALGEEAAGLFISAFGVWDRGNLIDRPWGDHPSLGGKNVLYQAVPIEGLAQSFGLSPRAVEKQLEESRQRLLSARRRRSPPLTDDKILTDWNGLMIAAFSKAAQVLQDPSLARPAQAAADFVLRAMRTPESGLLHRYRDGQAAIDGMLDDYAFLTWGLIELYEALFDERYLASALELTRDAIARFWDTESGGFFFTSDRGRQSLARRKEIVDGALPSGNSVALSNLVRLARLTEDTALEDKARALIKAFSPAVSRSPSWFCHFLVALDLVLGPSYEIVIAGEPRAPDTGLMLAALQRNYIPRTTVRLDPVGGSSNLGAGHLPVPATKPMLNGRATAYVCAGDASLPPTNEVDTLLESLGVRGRGDRPVV